MGLNLKKKKKKKDGKKKKPTVICLKWKLNHFNQDFQLQINILSIGTPYEIE